MGKSSEAASRIKRLRGSETQAEFARGIGVTQPMVSAWEAGRDTPSAEIWIKLGELAGYPDCYWFYERAGLDRQKLLAATEKTLKEQIKDADSPLLEGQIILVPRVRSLQSLEPAGLPLPMPAQAVPNALSTRCIEIEGTEVVVDTADTDAADLMPFWGRTVLLEFAPENEGPWPKGVLCAGILHGPHMKILPGRVDWHAEFVPFGKFAEWGSLPVAVWTEGWFQKNEPVATSEQSPVATVEQVRAGYIQRLKENYPRLPSESEWFARADKAEDERSYEIAAKVLLDSEIRNRQQERRAARELRIPAGCKILGRVIAQFPAVKR